MLTSMAGILKLSFDHLFNFSLIFPSLLFLHPPHHRCCISLFLLSTFAELKRAIFLIFIFVAVQFDAIGGLQSAL